MKNFILFSIQGLFDTPPWYQGPVWDRPYRVLREIVMNETVYMIPDRRFASIAVIKPLDRIGRIVASWFGRRPYGL